MMLLIVNTRDSCIFDHTGYCTAYIYDQSVNKYRLDSFESIIHSHFIEPSSPLLLLAS